MADYGRITIQNGKNYFYDDNTKKLGKEVQLKIGDTALDRNGNRNMWNGTTWISTKGGAVASKLTKKQNGSFTYYGRNDGTGYWKDSAGRRLAEDNILKIGNGNYKRLNPNGSQTILMENGQFTEEGNKLSELFKDNMRKGNVYDVRVSEVNGQKYSKARDIRTDQGEYNLARNIRVGWRNDTDFNTKQESVNTIGNKEKAERERLNREALNIKPQLNWLQQAKSNSSKRIEEVAKAKEFENFISNELSKDARVGTGELLSEPTKIDYTTPFKDQYSPESFFEQPAAVGDKNLKRNKAIQKYIETRGANDYQKALKGQETINTSKTLDRSATQLAQTGVGLMATTVAAPYILQGITHPTVLNIANKTLWQPVKFFGEGMLTNPLSTAGYIGASTATDLGLTKVGENYGIGDNKWFKAGKFIASNVVGGAGDLIGNTGASLIRGAITKSALKDYIGKHALAEKAEDMLLNHYGADASLGITNALKKNWLTAGVNTAVGTGIGTATEKLSDLSDNKVWKNFVSYYAPYILAKRVNTQAVKQAELASNGADNPATGAVNVMRSVQAEVTNPALKAKIKWMSRDPDKKYLIEKYLEAGNKAIRDQLKQSYPKFYTEDVVRTLNAYKLLNDEYAKRFTALYSSFQKEGSPNAWGGGTARGLSTLLSKLSGYTTLQFNRTKQDDVHTFIGTTIDKRDYKADNPNRVLSEIAASSGSKGKGKTDVYVYTQDKGVNDKFTSEVSDLYVVIKGKDGEIIRKPILKEDGTIDKQALREASFSQRQHDPKVGVKDSEGIGMRENWDGHRKILVARKGENGKDELAYTIGIDVAGGATMESHGNSGKLATLLDSYHPHNVTEIKIWEGIPHDNLFGLSTVALSSKTEIKSKQPTKGVINKIFNYVPNKLIDKANKRNYINARQHSQEFVSSKVEDLKKRKSLAEFYNSVFGGETFRVPNSKSSIKGITLDLEKTGDSYQKQYSKILDKIEGEIDSNYKNIYEKSSKTPAVMKQQKKNQKKKEKKQKISEQDIIRFQNLILDAPISVYEKYHKQGGKLNKLRELRQGGILNPAKKIDWEEYQKQNRKWKN